MLVTTFKLKHTKEIKPEVLSQLEDIFAEKVRNSIVEIRANESWDINTK